MVLLSKIKRVKEMDWQEFVDQKKSLEEKLGIVISNMDLFLEAFTHRSYANECKELPQNHNERLEFLGDSVLGLYSSKKLMEVYPDVTEGELTAKRAQIVRASSCALYVRKLGVETLLLVGKGEEVTSERALESMHADLFEALLAAIYLDQGWESAVKYLNQHIYPLMEELVDDETSQNWKAMLQELCQRQMRVTPTYRLLSESGPEHDKCFTMGVFVNDQVLADGKGKTKKEAEKAASKHAYAQLDNVDGN